MTAFRPGQSPPEVRIPIRMVMSASDVVGEGSLRVTL
jgi:hypothetical protein